jgi:hypothetical protein
LIAEGPGFREYWEWAIVDATERKWQARFEFAEHME